MHLQYDAILKQSYQTVWSKYHIEEVNEGKQREHVGLLEKFKLKTTWQHKIIFNLD